MKFSEHWLRTLVDPPIDSEELAQRLTMAVLEVEERTPAAPVFTGVVVGRVLAVARHPKGGRLTVCEVDVGKGAPLSIVCGAPNAAQGIVVPCALACPRLCGRVIEDIDPKAPSPEWMRRRLERSGIRAISAVVDVTNYVMLEQGQPLHAYDDALLEGAIVVRFPRRGEKLTLLNGQTLDLDPDLLLVADEAKPLGLAGIMGGEHSGIADTTRNVFLEGAFWNPAVIQGKARRLGFVTDAGYRFERGVDFANAPAAVDRATQLIIELCGGVAGPLVDVRGELPRRDPVRVRGARIARLLGIAIPPETVADIFKRLHLQPKRQGADFLCPPPSFRFDLAIEEDSI